MFIIPLIILDSSILFTPSGTKFPSIITGYPTSNNLSIAYIIPSKVTAEKRLLSFLSFTDIFSHSAILNVSLIKYGIFNDSDNFNANVDFPEAR